MTETTEIYCLSSGSQKSKVSLSGFISRWRQGCFNLKVLGENLFLPFPASTGRLHSLAHGPFFHLQSQQGSSFSPLWHFPLLQENGSLVSSQERIQGSQANDATQAVDFLKRKEIVRSQNGVRVSRAKRRATAQKNKEA